jgi:tRNA-binding EMAP/Myf-like protein
MTIGAVVVVVVVDKLLQLIVPNNVQGVGSGVMILSR